MTKTNLMKRVKKIKKERNKNKKDNRKLSRSQITKKTKSRQEKTIQK